MGTDKAKNEAALAAAAAEVEAAELRRTGLRMSLEEYAERYGASVRTVKRWRAIGGECGDEVPLDDPEAMLAWWARRMKQRVPAGINLAVVAMRKAAGVPQVKLELPVVAEAAPAVVAPVAAVPAPPPSDDDPVRDEDLGLEQTLRRLREQEVKLSRKAGEPGQAKPWLDTIARLGTVEQKLREEQERQGKLVPRLWAEQAIHDFHRPIEREIRALYRSMCDALGLPPSPEREAQWHAQCDKVFARFGEEVLRWE